MRRRDLFLGAGAATSLAAAYAVVRSMGSRADYDAAVAETRAALRQIPDLRDLVRYATLAPSGHNTQPWMFRMDPNRFQILPDPSRRTPAVDPDDHHLYVGLGCAAENLVLACEAQGRSVDLRFDPAGQGSVVIDPSRAAAVPSALFDMIPRRQSSRGDYDGRPVSNTDLQALMTAAAMPGVDLVLITDRLRIDRVRDLVLEGNSAQATDPAFMRELRSWLRFNPATALRTGDGLFSATTGAPILPDWLGPLAFDLAFKASSENDKYAHQMGSSAGVAVFVAHEADHAHWVQVGRAAQRFTLQATALGLKHAFINQPVEVPRLRPDLANLIGLPGRRPDLVLRFGAGALQPYSARRPIAEVLIA